MPSAAVWAVWFVVTVPAPLLIADVSGPVETFPHGSELHLWTFAALPVLAALGARRWTLGRSRGGAAFLGALGAALVTGVVSLAVSVVVFRWFVPLDEPAGWTFFGALPLALVGGVAGYAAGFRGGGRPRMWRYAAGAVITFFGLVTVTAALGVAARESARPVVDGLPADPAIVALLPEHRLEPGRWAVYRYDAEESVQGCVVTGRDGSRRDVERLTVPVNWSNDGTADIWVGDIDIPETGIYLLNCPTPDVGISNVRVDGAVAAMVGWPWAAVWLLGAAPGLTILADTALRRRGRKPAPAAAAVSG